MGWVVLYYIVFMRTSYIMICCCAAMPARNGRFSRLQADVKVSEREPIYISANLKIDKDKKLTWLINRRWKSFLKSFAV